MRINFGIIRELTPKELGQLKSLRKFLGEFTLHVVEWMLNPIHWWRFSQQVCAEAKCSVPDLPHVGFLLAQRGRALKVVRRELQDSTNAADVAFMNKLDDLRFAQMKALLLVLAAGMDKQLAKTEQAKNLTELQRIFTEGGEGFRDWARKH